MYMINLVPCCGIYLPPMTYVPMKAISIMFHNKYILMYTNYHWFNFFHTSHGHRGSYKHITIVLFNFLFVHIVIITPLSYHLYMCMYIYIYIYVCVITDLNMGYIQHFHNYTVINFMHVKRKLISYLFKYMHQKFKYLHWRKMIWISFL